MYHTINTLYKSNKFWTQYWAINGANYLAVGVWAWFGGGMSDARVNNEAVREALLKVSPIQNSIEPPIWQKDENLLEFLKNLSDQ